MIYFELRTPYNPGDKDPGAVYTHAGLMAFAYEQRQVRVILRLGTEQNDSFVPGKEQPTAVVLKNRPRLNQLTYDDLEPSLLALARELAVTVGKLDTRWAEAVAPEPEAEPEPEPEAAPDAEPEPEPEAAPDAEPEAAPDAEPEPAPDLDDDDELAPAPSPNVPDLGPIDPGDGEADPEPAPAPVKSERSVVVEVPEGVVE